MENNSHRILRIYEDKYGQEQGVALVEVPTMRDQFAMAALNGITANAFKVGGPEYFANQAYAIADAMLKAREAK
jgi:hypothetical protein